ncbi:MAG: ABC transporter ATP-binding protein [Candidatus Bathyarchaeota archaeon]
MKKLRIENVSKAYGKVQAVKHVNLAVDVGEFMTIMGPSGSGKSTLLLTVLGVLRVDEGHIYLDEALVDTVPMEERNIGYVPQDFGLFPHMTVYDNIAFGLKVRKQNRQETEKRVKNLLTSMGLSGLEDRKPQELSGGQKQRVALARALAIQPVLLLLDEPLSNIDLATKVEVRKNLKDTIKKFGITTLGVMHDPTDCFELGDRIAIMCYGEIIQVGAAREVLNNPVSNLVRSLISPCTSNR